MLSFADYSPCHRTCNINTIIENNAICWTKYTASISYHFMLYFATVIVYGELKVIKRAIR